MVARETLAHLHPPFIRLCLLGIWLCFVKACLRAVCSSGWRRGGGGGILPLTCCCLHSSSGQNFSVGHSTLGIQYWADIALMSDLLWISGTPLITKRKGYGVYKEGNNKYEGYWDDDKMSGEGTMFFASGAVYTGTWLDNCFDGKGKYSWTDSSFYEGMWRSNKMHGEGMYQDSTGKRWHGKFYNGMGPGITLNTAV